MTPPVASIDNATRHADDFDDLAARRAWVAARPPAAKRVLAWPTAERLARLESPAAAQALYRYAEMSRPVQMLAVNDNREPGVDGPDIDVDMEYETRPRPMEMLRAAASDGFRVSVTSVRVSGAWIVTKQKRGTEATDGKLGDLVFRDGQLISWGTTARGKTLKPVERPARQKGGTRPKRSILSIRGLLPKDSKTPIARGSAWLGGMTRPRGNTSRPEIGDALAEVEFHRSATRSAIRLALGSETVAILDAAITDSSAQSIGEAFGYAGKVAERRGIEKINDAIKMLQEIAA